MEEKEKDIQSTEDYSEQASGIRELVSELSSIIDKHEDLKQLNFGLFYQHGRLAYVDLDHFANTVKAKLEVDGEEKSLTELKQEIDKDKE